MKFKILALLFISSISSFGQNWTALPNSRILCLNFAEANSTEFKYRNFKNGESLIIVEKSLSEDFIKLFTSNPEVFDDIYKVAYTINEKSELLNPPGQADDVIKDLEFKHAVTITDRNLVNGINEFIWVLTNGIELEPCYINLVFEKNKKRKSKYIGAVKSHCAI